MGEADIRSYGVSVHPDTPSLSWRLRVVNGSNATQRRYDAAHPSEVCAADTLVDEELVEKYRRSCEWESRRLDAIDTPECLMVVDGHHRLAAATAEGARQVLLVVHDPGLRLL